MNTPIPDTYGIVWRDSQQRAGFILGARVFVLLVALLLLGALCAGCGHPYETAERASDIQPCAATINEGPAARTDALRRFCAALEDRCDALEARVSALESPGRPAAAKEMK